MALVTVADYIRDARILLQDTVSEYRYADSDLVEALNIAIREAVRLRPDLFFKLLRTGGGLPTYSSSTTSTTVAVDQRYQSSMLYYIVGWVQLRDDENTQDSRSAVLLNKFASQFLTIPA